MCMTLVSRGARHASTRLTDLVTISRHQMRIHSPSPLEKRGLCPAPLRVGAACPARRPDTRKTSTPWNLTWLSTKTPPLEPPIGRAGALIFSRQIHYWLGGSYILGPLRSQPRSSGPPLALPATYRYCLRTAAPRPLCLLPRYVRNILPRWRRPARKEYCRLPGISTIVFLPPPPWWPPVQCPETLILPGGTAQHIQVCAGRTGYYKGVTDR